jgi:molecular chaperone GrpE
MTTDERETLDPAAEEEVASSSADSDSSAGSPSAETAPDSTEPTLPSESATAEPSLEEQLEKAREDAKTTRERMLRVAADFENFRKRTGRELEEVRRRATQDAVKTLLPVFDNLERATTHLDDTTDARSMAEGIQMVHRQFIDTLSKLGIERVPALGLPFDPMVHESIQYEHSEEHAAGSVMTELQPGYRTGDMLLRPALVVVSRGPLPMPSVEPTGPASASHGNGESDEGRDGDESPSEG